MREEYVKIVTQNSFSRSIANDAKAGFYPTDPAHCISASTFFDFGDKEVCCFDCCAGQGKALIDVTQPGKEGRNVKLFVNDLNADNVAALRNAQIFEAVVCADYLNRVIRDRGHSCHLCKIIKVV